MAINSKPRILFFIDGGVPTIEQREEAEAMGGNVGFRNFRFSREDEAIEQFDDLAGDPPSWYLAALDAKREAREGAVPVPQAASAALPATGSPIAPAAPAAGAPAGASGGGWRPNA